MFFSSLKQIQNVRKFRNCRIFQDFPEDSVGFSDSQIPDSGIRNAICDPSPENRYNIQIFTVGIQSRISTLRYVQ
jgi:hypothetical protein